MATISKQKKVKRVRQKLKLFRASDPLKSVLMWGINYSFSALNHVKPRTLLLKDDFKASMKVKISNHLFNKDSMPSHFKFKEYCPMVFKNLRDRFNVNKFDFWDAFTRHQPSWDSPRGKSGSKLLITHNRQFVAKTINSEESEQLTQLLEPYHASKPLPTLKDNDFLNDLCKIHIGSESKSRLMNLLESDVQFLQENNLTDYSLLIGVHEVGLHGNSVTESNEPGNGSACEPDYTVEDRVVSAGDGLGSMVSSWQLRKLSLGRCNTLNPSVAPGSFSATQGSSNWSGGEEDEDEEGALLSDPGNPDLGAAGSLTPPDSPSARFRNDQLYTGELHPTLEFYGIKSSTDSPHSLVYFIAIIDILTRYGMRKRMYGSSLETSSVKPELYGRRLLEFMSQYVQ